MATRWATKVTTACYPNKLSQQRGINSVSSEAPLIAVQILI